MLNMGFFSRNQNDSVTKCKNCGTEFPNSSRLKKHFEIAHKKTNEKCRKCGSEFHTSDELRKHKKKCK